MLTFFATLLVNVLVGTIFYLVISLRIEKSASEVHVKRIRKEMDTMIREFNMTADRNISLLENRIAVMKRLLEKGGEAGFSALAEAPVLPAATGEYAEEELEARPLEDPHPKGLGGAISHSAEFILSIGAGLKHAIREVNTIRETERAEKRALEAKKKAGPAAAESDSAVQEAAAGEKARADRAAAIIREEREIEKMFSRIADRKEAYALAGKLFGQGYSVERIAQLSGIPAGEVSLIVQLAGR